MKKNKVDHKKESLFRELYQHYHTQVYAYLFAHTGNKLVAEDLLQELYMRVWKQIATIDLIKANQRRYWLFKVAKNLTTDYYRKQNTSKQIQQIVEQQVFTSKQSEGDISQKVEDKETLHQLDIEIWKLEEDLRSILILQVMGGMTSSQIGEALDIPAGTVRYKLSMARKKLTAALDHIPMEGGHVK